MPWVSIGVLLLFSVCSGNSKLTTQQIAELTATEAIDLLCSRKLTAVQYATALLERAEKYECINSFQTRLDDQVLADAKAVDDAAKAGKDVGPLCGLAYAVKDNIDVVGYPTSGGTPALEGMMPPNSSTLITKLLDAHGIVLGKMRMHELAEGGTTINVFGGPVLNPYGNTMHVGGSSGGTTAAVAMRLAPAGFCSDTGGSCRIPASVTGVIGFRPTTGCWPAADGIVPMSTTRDTVGVNARSMADVMLFNDIFSECSKTKAYSSVVPKGLRVGYPRNFWNDTGEETHAAFDAALEAMRAAGVEIVPMDMGLLIDTMRKEMADPLFYTFEMPRELARYMYTHGYNISIPHLVDKIASPLVKKAMEHRAYKTLDSWPTPADYTHALQHTVPKLKAIWASYHTTYDVDVLVVPATPITARPIDDVEPYVAINGRYEDNLWIYDRTNQLDCVLGIPGVSLPAGLASDGLPIGIMFYGRAGDDATLLSVAAALEPLFAPTPPPPEEQPCEGCIPAVSVKEVTWDGVGKPLPTDTTSCYDLVLHGECALKKDGAPKPLIGHTIAHSEL